MKNLFLKLFAIILLAGFSHACNETLVEEQQPVDDLELKSAQNNKQSYIVLLEDAELNAELSGLKVYENRQAAALKAASKVLKRAGIADGQIGHVYGTAIKGFSVTISPGQLKKLEDDPSVVRVEEDKIITLIEPISISPNGDLDAQNQNTPWGITRVKGGATYENSKVAWIIDTGIDHDHPDLNVDASRGAYFVGRGTKSSDDDNGHGTHVAGTVAAIDNGIGVIGVAAGATVIPVKVLDRTGSGTLSGVIAGVNYVADNAADGDVANMSLGGGAYSDLDNAVKNASEQDGKKIYFSLAAGNDGDDANNYSPARVNGPYIFTISAMDSNDQWASWSNWGNPPVDFCEPGVSIYSTYKDGGYATASGTSMAAPHMAGILLWGEPAFEKDENDNIITVKNDPDGNPDTIGVVGGVEVASVSISPTSIEDEQEAGLSITYTFTVENTGDVQDSYEVSLSSLWDSSSDKTTLNLAAGTSETVNVTHTVPSIASPGDSDTGTLSVTSTKTSASASATFTTTATGYAVQVTPESQSGTGTPGDEVDYVYTISNTGTENDTYDLSTTTSFWVSSVNPTSVSVSAGSSTDVTVSHTIPLDAADGSSETGTLNIESTGDATVSTSAEFTTTVAESVPPVIESYTLTDKSNPAWTRATVDWIVSDGDGDLESVTTTMKDSDGNEIDSVTSSVSGSSASGTHEVGVRGGGKSYTVTLTVTDKNNNVVTEDLE